MRTRPDDLTDADLARALARWPVGAIDLLEYAPVGFGDHHWRVHGADGRRWFVTVAITATKDPGGAPAAGLEALRRSMGTARALADDGLDLVIAPIPSVGGELVACLGDRHAVCLFPHVEGESGDFSRDQSPRERTATIEVLARLHQHPAPASTPAIPWSLPERTSLTGALADLDRRWDGGPHGEPARAALRAGAARVRAALARYDELVAAAEASDPRLVLSHGEPHPGNRILRADGRLVLVDWDGVGLSAPERDLCDVLRDAAEHERYEELTGHRPDPERLTLFRLRWDLADLGGYLGAFREPHRATLDAEQALDELVELVARLPERGADT
jgi:Predicted choline kinase involved in LPS biosynthesis